jgi:hypothetical protein
VVLVREIERLARRTTRVETMRALPGAIRTRMRRLKIGSRISAGAVRERTPSVTGVAACVRARESGRSVSNSSDRGLLDRAT